MRKILCGHASLQASSLLNPEIDGIDGWAEIAALHGGDVELENLAVQSPQGSLDKLRRGRNSYMEQQSAILAANTGNSGEVSQRHPFINVPNGNLEFAGKIAALMGRCPLLQEIEGHLNSVMRQERQIFGQESGELFDRPIRGGNTLRF